jgi:hypothetical protein
MGKPISGLWVQRFVLITVFCASSMATMSAQSQEIAAPRPYPAVSGGFSAAIDQEVRRLGAQGVRTETRRSDSLLNGALIGAAAGVASELLLCRAMEPWDVCNDVGPMLRFGAVGAAIGIGVDALIRQRVPDVSATTGPGRVRVAPIAGRGAGGVRVTLGF